MGEETKDTLAALLVSVRNVSYKLRDLPSPLIPM